MINLNLKSILKVRLIKRVELWFNTFKNRYWNDPVYSKLIANVITWASVATFTFLLALIAFIASKIQNVSFLETIENFIGYWDQTRQTNNLFFWLAIASWILIFIIALQHLRKHKKPRIKSETPSIENVIIVKSSELEEPYVFALKRVIKSLIPITIETPVTLNYDPLYRNCDIPDLDYIINEIQYNFNSTNSPQKYLERLRLDFEITYQIDVTGDLRELKSKCLFDLAELKKLTSDVDFDPIDNSIFFLGQDSQEQEYSASDAEYWFKIEATKYFFEDYELTDESEYRNDGMYNVLYLVEACTTAIRTNELCIKNARNLIEVIETVKESILKYGKTTK